MAIKPLGKRLLVSMVDTEQEVSKAGLVLLDTAKEKPLEGVVVDLGSEHRSIDLGDVNLSIGDRVLFGKYSGTEITIEGERHLIISYEDIIAVKTH